MRFILMALCAFSITAAQADDGGWEEIPDDEPGCGLDCFPDDDQQSPGGGTNVYIENNIHIENNIYIQNGGQIGNGNYQQPFYEDCYAVGGPQGWTIYRGHNALASGYYRSDFFQMKRYLYQTGQCPNL